jgi:plastocyanin
MNLLWSGEPRKTILYNRAFPWALYDKFFFLAGNIFSANKLSKSDDSAAGVAHVSKGQKSIERERTHTRAPNMKRTCLSLGIAAIVILLAMAADRTRGFGSAAAQEKAAAETAVKIDNLTFSPVAVTVPVGSSVRWTNHDDIPHNVTSDDDSFKSKTLRTDENFSYTFNQAGTYSYYCSIHPRMAGKIVVK